MIEIAIYFVCLVFIGLVSAAEVSGMKIIRLVSVMYWLAMAFVVVKGFWFIAELDISHL